MKLIYKAIYRGPVSPQFITGDGAHLVTRIVYEQISFIGRVSCLETIHQLVTDRESPKFTMPFWGKLKFCHTLTYDHICIFTYIYINIRTLSPTRALRLTTEPDPLPIRLIKLTYPTYGRGKSSQLPLKGIC